MVGRTTNALHAGAGLLVTLLIVGGCHQMFDGNIEAFRCNIEGGYGPPACPEGNTCVAGLCTDVGAPLGDVCVADDDCRVGRCIDPAAFGASGEPRCSHLCCNSSDCGAPSEGLVCWLPASTTGGMCWPAEALDRPAPGIGRPGASCSGPSDCRSGVCDGSVCSDACCDDSYCDDPDVCRVKASGAVEGPTFACGQPFGPGLSGICESPDDCASGMCVPGNDMVDICATPCCSSADCESVLIGTVLRPVACVPIDGRLRGCGQILPITAVGGLGAPCENGDDCRSGLCVDRPEGRICSDTCCRDADCGDSSAFRCKPTPVEQTWALRCVPE